MMKKNPKKIIIIGIIFVFVLLFGFIQTDLFSVTGGGTVMSVDNARFVSNNENLESDDAYLIDVVVNRGGERLVGEITPEQIEQYGIEKVPEGAFKIYFDLETISCNYNIIDAEEPFYKMYQATVRGGRLDQGAECPYGSINLDDVERHCEGTYNSAPGTGNPTPSSAVDREDCDSLVDIQETPTRPDLGQQASEWCYAMPPDTSRDSERWRVTHIAGAPQFTGDDIGTVASPKFSVDVTIENSKGENVTTEITSEKTSAMLEDIGRVKFAGGLLAQQFCPVPAVNYKVIDKKGNKSLVDRADYEQYQDNLAELISFDNNYFEYTFVAPTTTRRVDPGVGADVIFEKMSTLNSLQRELSSQNMEDECRIDGSILKCKPERDVVYPQLQILLRADWVGVEANSGMPDIRQVFEPENPLAGDVNNIEITIDNIGRKKDSFDIGLRCDGREVNLGNVRISIPSKETRTISQNFVMEEGEHSCKITATSVNNPLASDSYEFDIEVFEKEFPEIEQCESVPDQPEANCLWEGYPDCEWKCYDSEPINYSLLIMGGIGALMLVIGTTVYMKKRK